MRYIFVLSLIAVCLLAVVNAGNQQSQNNNAIGNRIKSNRQNNVAVHQRTKQVTKQRTAKGNKNAVKRQSSIKKKGVLIERDGKKRRAIIKSKPRRKVIKAVRKVSRRVNRAKPAAKNSNKRRANQVRKRLAKQEEADIGSTDQESFGEDQQSSEASSSDTSNVDQISSTVDETAEQPAAPPAAAPSVPAESSPAKPSGLPSNFNFPGLNNLNGKNSAYGAGFSQLNGPGVGIGVGFATSNGVQSSAGGFGATFSAPDLSKINPVENSPEPENVETSDEIAQLRRPRPGNRRQDRFRG